MNDSSAQSRQHYLFALLLFMAGLLIILIFLTVRSQADDSTTSANISNEAPTVNSVYISSTDCGATQSVTLADNTTVGAYLCGTFTDNNGCNEVVTSSVGMRAVFSSPSTDASCSADNSDCYIVASTTCSITNCTGGTDLLANYSCPISAYYYATAGTWTGTVVAVDGVSTSTANTATTTVSTLTAIDIAGGSLDFGTLPFSSTSPDKNLTASNSGNQTTDLYIRGTRMACTLSALATTSVHYATGTGVDYASMDVATDSSGGALKDVNLVRRTQGAASTQTLSFKLQTPASGVSGSCSGYVYVNAG